MWSTMHVRELQINVTKTTLNEQSKSWAYNAKHSESADQRTSGECSGEVQHKRMPQKLEKKKNDNKFSYLS